MTREATHAELYAENGRLREELGKALDTIDAFARAETWAGEDDRPLKEDAEIRAAFPTRSERHDLYREACRLVGARRSKYGLIALVTWLLLRAEKSGAATKK